MPLDSLGGFANRFQKHFPKLGLHSVRDLLWHLPTRYEDYSRIVPIADLAAGETVTVIGRVTAVNQHYTRNWRYRTILEATLQDESGEARAVWFNMPYLRSSLREGQTYRFSGKVALVRKELALTHPSFQEAASEEDGSVPPLFQGEARRGVPPLFQGEARWGVPPLFQGEARWGAPGPPSNPRQSATRPAGRVVPIYPETKGLTSRGLHYLIQHTLPRLGSLPDPLPQEILRGHNLPEINTALRQIHSPGDLAEAKAARRRFQFENLFLLQLANQQTRSALAQEQAPAIPSDLDRVRAMLAALPFQLTFSQKRSLWEIVQDLAKPRPMNRLLQGDVGSGKTVVAVLAAFLAYEHGYQTALLAPTEILARQHYETIKKFMSHMRTHAERTPINTSYPSHKSYLSNKSYYSLLPTVGLLLGSEAKTHFGRHLETPITKKRLAEMIKNNQAHILIGTHALIQKTVQFSKLGLVIVDEQHRFGVRQRQALMHRTTALVPHFLSMSATPIPRTLALTVFGDLDISTIAELPAGRKKIITRIVPPGKRSAAYDFIRKQVQAGRQAFVICPRIEEARNSPNISPIRPIGPIRPIRPIRPTNSSFFSEEIRTVIKEYEKLSRQIFPDLRVGMLHGKMRKSADPDPSSLPFSKGRPGGVSALYAPSKESVMAAFREGKIDVLVSTSVVEVGVDIPNASVMVIEGADRFGLAQLYQFHGRVGRGEHQSYCLLFTESVAQTTTRRLEALLRAKNGLELAEYDLKLRGPGELLGERQSGVPDTLLAGLTDLELVRSARESARDLLASDPDLTAHSLLRESAAALARRLHPE
ncbi:MAG: ATP-dependent DNA helicase RecG [Candidatus Liptonbacteria bacterium]|nr:ATP-dependent DNA helicase RecG [Candidatus Liptonbacteria bacterium]